MNRKPVRRAGTVLIAVLVVVVILSLAAYKYSELMSGELRATNRILKASQVKAFAESGVHYAAAVLATTDTITSNLGGNPFDNASAFQGRSVGDGDRATSRGMFSIVSIDYGEDPSEAGEFAMKYGVADEAAKININSMIKLDPTGQKLHDMLMKLPNMTEEIADAIVDWVDADSDPRANGAEDDHYSSLSPPYRCKNGPLDSLEELLFVRGVTPALLFGNDRSKNGRIDPGEDASSGGVDAGWAPYLTVYSRELNTDIDGLDRIYLNDTDIPTLYTNLQGVLDKDVAAYIIAYRTFSSVTTASTAATTAVVTAITSSQGGGTMTFQLGGNGGGGQTPTPRVGTADELVALVDQQAPSAKSKRNIKSLFSLLGTSVTVPAQGRTPAVTYTFPLTDAARLKDQLPKAMDKTTTVQGTEIPARININTAPRPVLLALPGLTETDVDNIISKRPAEGSTGDLLYDTPAWIVTELTLNPLVLQGLESYVTTRSEVYRFQSIGYFEEGGPLFRVEAVVDANKGKPRVIYYRDLTELGRAFDPRQNQ